MARPFLAAIPYWDASVVAARGLVQASGVPVRQDNSKHLFFCEAFKVTQFVDRFYHVCFTRSVVFCI